MLRTYYGDAVASQDDVGDGLGLARGANVAGGGAARLADENAHSVPVGQYAYGRRVPAVGESNGDALLDVGDAGLAARPTSRGCGRSLRWGRSPYREPAWTRAVAIKRATHTRGTRLMRATNVGRVACDAH